MCTEREIVRESTLVPSTKMDMAMKTDVRSVGTVLEKIAENSRPLGWCRSPSRIPAKSGTRNSTPEVKPQAEKRVPSPGPRERPVNTPTTQEKPTEGKPGSRLRNPSSSPSLASQHLQASSEPGKAVTIDSPQVRASPSPALAVKPVPHTVSSSVPSQFAKFSSLMNQLARSSLQSASTGPSAINALRPDKCSPAPSPGVTKPPSLSSNSRTRLSLIPPSSPSSDTKPRPSTSIKSSAAAISSLTSSWVSRPSSHSRTDAKAARSLAVVSSATLNKVNRAPSPSRSNSQPSATAPSVARTSYSAVSRPTSQRPVASSRPSTPTRVGAPSSAAPSKSQTSTRTRTNTAPGSLTATTITSFRTGAPRSLNSGPAASVAPSPSNSSSSSPTCDNLFTRRSSPAPSSAATAIRHSASVSAAIPPASPSRSFLKSSGSSSYLTSATTTTCPPSASRIAKHSAAPSCAIPVSVATNPASPSRPVPTKPAGTSANLHVVATRPAAPSPVAKLSVSSFCSFHSNGVANGSASPLRAVAPSPSSSSNLVVRSATATKAAPTDTHLPRSKRSLLTKAKTIPLPTTPVEVTASGSSSTMTCHDIASSSNLVSLEAVASSFTQPHSRSLPSKSPESNIASRGDYNLDTPLSSGDLVAARKSIQEFQAQQLQLAGFKHSSGSLKTNLRAVPEGSLPVSPLSINGKKRCGWITSQSDAAMVAYHDEEWGIPIYDDKLLFELMVLEGAQADMSWSSILALRDDFRVAFMGFDPAVVAKFDEKKIATLIANPRIRIPEAKIRGAIDNAKRVLEIVDECGSLRIFLWSFVNYKPVVSHYKLPNQVSVRTPRSEALSNELLRRGFRYVGPTTMYALMQATGLVNDHLVTCFRHQEWAALHKSPLPTGVYNEIPEVERWSQPDGDRWAFTSNFDCKTLPVFGPDHQSNNSRLSSIPCEPVWAQLPMIEEAFEDEM